MHARELIAEVLRAEVSIPSGELLLAHIEGWDSLKGVRLVASAGGNRRPRIVRE